MLSDGAGSRTARSSVGYESPSQFSREYARLFGAPPRRDVEALRPDSGAQMSAQVAPGAIAERWSQPVQQG